MNVQNFDKWGDMAKRMQEPFQALAELNVKTLQSLTYMKPDELAHLKRPEEFVEKQLCIAIENGHKGLDYIQKAFQILEKATLSAARDVKNKTEGRR